MPVMPRNDQLERFKKAARELGSDESEEAFDVALKRMGSAPPAPLEKKRSRPAKKRAKTSPRR